MPCDDDSLEKIDWEALEHCYGPAVEVPGLLRAVWSRDFKTRNGAYRKLVDLLVHQGSSFEASPVAVPFLIDVVADDKAPDRFAACQVLTAIAIGDEASWLSRPHDLPAIRRDVERQASMTIEQLRPGDQLSWLSGWIQRVAARSLARPVTARMMSGRTSRRPVKRCSGRHHLSRAMACSTGMRCEDWTLRAAS
jgi:hypothetical protein